MARKYKKVTLWSRASRVKRLFPYNFLYKTLY
nr:MAG TPA: hypothetical protein [Caudoviricetes sp.]